MEYIGLFVLWVGIFFSITGVLGLLRFPDVYTRIHASGKVSTLGLLFILAGTSILMPQILPRAIVLIAFMVLTAPVASNSIATAAHRNFGLRVGKRDDLAAYNKAKGEEPVEQVEERAPEGVPEHPPEEPLENSTDPLSSDVLDELANGDQNGTA